MLKMTEARISKVPLHRWVVRAVIGVTADEADAIAHGRDGVLPRTSEFVRYEGPNCFGCGAAYEPGGSEECSAGKRVVTKVQF
jgi:hypothetical protein